MKREDDKCCRVIVLNEEAYKRVDISNDLKVDGGDEIRVKDSQMRSASYFNPTK